MARVLSLQVPHRVLFDVNVLQVGADNFAKTHLRTALRKIIVQMADIVFMKPLRVSSLPKVVHHSITTLGAFVRLQNSCSNSSICNGNGLCQQYMGSTDLYCDCNEGYFGEFCEATLNSCNPELEGYWRCENGGVCHSKGPMIRKLTSGSSSANASCSCLPGWHGSSLSMPEGYTGQHCKQALDPCTKFPYGDPWICGGHGKCTSLGLGYNAPHSCVCDAGWLEFQSCMQCEDICAEPFVSNAEHKRSIYYERTRKSADLLNKENDARCSGHGTCLPRSGDSKNFLCACNAGHYGNKCEKVVDYCALQSICMNNGECTNILDDVNLAVVDYNCTCGKGFSGLNCEIEESVNPCNPNPCKNDGYCQPKLSEDSYTCHCSQNYNSTNDCGTKINQCEATPKYCNKGTCIVMNSTNYTYCNCPAQYTGLRCETKKNQNFNLYFSGSQTSAVRQRIISKTVEAVALLESGYALCAWVRLGADSANAYDNVGSLKPFAMIGIVQDGQVVKELVALSGTGAVITDNLVYLNHTLSQHVWHHICFVFKTYPTDSTSVLSDLELYVDGNLVRSSENNLIQLPDTLTENTQAAVLLGQMVGEDTSSFVGEISLVQLYNTPLNGSTVWDMVRDCRPYTRSHSSDLAVAWTDFTIIDMFNSAVMAIYPGICVTATCLPNMTDCSADHDKSPPEVIVCPSNQYIVVTDNNRLVQVHWDDSMEHMFKDNGVITQFTSNFRSGQTFGWGEHHVVYIARDAASNLATCQFDIIISPQNCPQPVHEDDFTVVKLRDLPISFAKQVAEVECNGVNYVFNNPKPPFYTCDLMGRWDRFSPTGSSFTLPSCSPTNSPEQNLIGTVNFQGQCIHVNDYRDQVKQSLLNASETFGGFCNKKNCEGQIGWRNNCPSPTDKVARRAVGEDELVFIEYTLRVNNTRNPVQSVIAEEMDNTFGDDFQGMRSEISCGSEYPLLHVSNGTETKKRLSSLLLLTAQSNTSWSNVMIQCSCCAAGEEWHLVKKDDDSSGMCIKCPADTFKSDKGAGPCVVCPLGRITGNLTGCIREIDCYIKCPAGQVYQSSNDSCAPCPKGQFMPYSGRLKCFSCPSYLTTISTGAKTAEECSVSCPPGQEMLPTEECAKCQRGTYRSVELLTCQKCSLGFSTMSDGAKSADQCNQVFCPSGFSSKPNILMAEYNQQTGGLLDVCLECDVGFYQNEPNSSSCIRCPHMKTTANKGARSEVECDQPVDLSCTPNQPNHCPDLMECVQTETSGYECRYLSDRRDPSDQETPLVTMLVIGVSSMVFASAIVMTVVVYHNKWTMLYYRYCPSCLLCFKKMTVNDISGDDYSRDSINVPVTQGSTADAIFVNGEEEYAAHTNGTAMLDRKNSNQPKTVSPKESYFEEEEDARSRSIAHAAKTRLEKSEENHSVKSSSLQNMDENTTREPIPIQDPLNDIRSTLMDIFGGEYDELRPVYPITSSSNIRPQAETPPPVPQANLRVQTSHNQHSKYIIHQADTSHHFSTSQTYSDDGDSTTINQKQKQHRSSNRKAAAAFSSSGSYARATDAIGRRIFGANEESEESQFSGIRRIPLGTPRKHSTVKERKNKIEKEGIESPTSSTSSKKISPQLPNNSIPTESMSDYALKRVFGSRLSTTTNSGLEDYARAKSLSPNRTTPRLAIRRPTELTVDDDDDAFFS
uniref:Uncharacterized protein n=1 Tax=Ditylenchus dipsaci TaxID=166011 RepID=A0A915E9U8_9BILA